MTASDHSHYQKHLKIKTPKSEQPQVIQNNTKNSRAEQKSKKKKERKRTYKRQESFLRRQERTLELTVRKRDGEKGGEREQER